jgi:hypothetical protein
LGLEQQLQFLQLLLNTSGRCSNCSTRGLCAYALQCTATQSETRCMCATPQDNPDLWSLLALLLLLLCCGRCSDCVGVGFNAWPHRALYL